MRPGFLVGTAVLSAAGLACSLGWVTELARVQVRQAPVLHENRAEDVQVPVVVAEWLRRWTRNPLGSPRAGSNPADYVVRQPSCTPRRSGRASFCTSLARLCAPPLHRTNTPLDLFADVGHSRGTVAHLDRIVVSTLPCGRSNPGHGSLLLSSNGDVGLLFASSSFSWILSLTPVASCAALLQPRELEGRSDVLEIHWGLEILHAEEKRLCLFFTPLACFFATLSASDKHAAGPFSSRGTVAHLDRIVVSTLPCGRSNPGHGSLLLSSNGDVGLLFASSSFSWILSLTLGGVLCCPPAAKGAGGPQLVIGVVVAERLRRWT
ncbi:hypothetical protein G5714_019258 [Onychostoma macrolepis]|uniref:Uncharacterized protein n=1 Tax=Onychostoma macrolepis TaxID=369639 RepID=A0A7J6BZU4_9TELE|nr:hypothetical protein G5714_019258 [Onychostoma macrolepis]